MREYRFHAGVWRWLREQFGGPTAIQERGWRAIQGGGDVLLAAPTGSGKTLAGFLCAIDRHLREELVCQQTETLHRTTSHRARPSQRISIGRPAGVGTLYISPLKALNNDIARNLQAPLAGIVRACGEISAGEGLPSLRVAVRSGDTSPAERAKMLRYPPHILATTPESLYILLTSARARAMLRGVHTVILDEIHALVESKRGAHLMLSLARLDRLRASGSGPAQRIGLSATQRPLGLVAAFLVGCMPAAAEVVVDDASTGAALDAASTGDAADGTSRPAVDRAAGAVPDGVTEDLVVRPCTIVDGGHRRQLDVRIELPETPLAAVASAELMNEVHARLLDLIEGHRTTLIFVQTRAAAEKLARALRTARHEAGGSRGGDHLSSWQHVS